MINNIINEYIELMQMKESLEQRLEVLKLQITEDFETNNFEKKHDYGNLTVTRVEETIASRLDSKKVQKMLTEEQYNQCLTQTIRKGYYNIKVNN